MKKTIAIVFSLLLCVLGAFAQEVSAPNGVVVGGNATANNVTVTNGASKQEVKPEKSALEQNYYYDAMAAVQKQKDKEEADKKKAAAEAEAKKRASFVTYSALERALQENMAEDKANRKQIAELKKLLIRKQKLLAEVSAIDQKLNAGNQRIVAVEKIQPDADK